jgi:acetyl esterase/lipase
MNTPWVIGPEPDHVITYGSHPDQLIEFYEGDGPLVTLIHGGYWRPVHTREHMRALGSKLAANGFKVANIEYRREAGKPENLFNDVNTALSELTDSIALIGFSVGGQIAMVSNNNVHKLILLAPVTDLERTKEEGLGDNAVVEFFGNTDISNFDPMKKDLDQHLYIIHGDSDQRVPLSHSRDFAKAKGASLMEITGGDHFSVINPEGLAFDLILRTLLSK